ncbi:hypothetical protein GQ44DRAFT_826746 [Phaeosphaeriaceae sp. PMI808]|nr:hypothetical protein GQ44DRAFT_826746 [Phaeosphaeriaceae sp. PMI808]
MVDTLPHPGIMIVHPRLHDDTPENAATFLRWSKLHFRDIVSVPQDADVGRMPLASMYIAPDGNALYGHEASKISKFFNVIYATSIPVFKSPQYYAMSRRLDLENTRALGEGEEVVCCEEGKMVWDVVDARFVIYELEKSANFDGVKSLQTRETMPGSKSLVGVAFTSDNTGDAVLKVQQSLLGFLSNQSPEGIRMFSDLYRNAGASAQPDMHPVIDKAEVGGGEWLVLVLLVDENDKHGVEDVEKAVEAWAEKEKGVGVQYGVWGGAIEVS